MVTQTLLDYISRLPIAPLESLTKAVRGPQRPVDLDKIPTAIVDGSNMVLYPPSVPSEIRTSVALSLLAAQQVAQADSKISTPKQWLDRHNVVLTTLTWTAGAEETVQEEFDDLNVAAHKAIIPFLTAAFGPYAAIGSLIITALNQLQDMDKDSPWITLFDHQSRHFDSTMHQFSVVNVVDKHVELRIASARFDAWSETTQVLFVKIKDVAAKFSAAGRTFSAEAELLADIKDALRKKLANSARILIDTIPDDLLKTEKRRTTVREPAVA